MDIAIAADHAGFEYREEIVRWLRNGSHHVADLGVFDRSPADYPDVAEAVALAVREHDADRGILICGSAVGVSVAANKLPGIRAGICHDAYSARQGVEHDNINVLCLGQRVIGLELAREIVRIFLDARFSGEDRHVRRLTKVTALERRWMRQSADCES